ncbi:RCC1 domain-containing protein RUG3, mitochondrial [Cryptomeria japonica]|uniref:RCC1 domain-containing protein RUG3, mitochondrial n=1 Tax=Cryptomeria japonica TaxID=3369 RepID=UPI0027DA994E|nr:RCC1 domain-containing protein RUG3, mitochondrial [Cryptomeria japonica]
MNKWKSIGCYGTSLFRSQGSTQTSGLSLIHYVSNRKFSQKGDNVLDEVWTIGRDEEGPRTLVELLSWGRGSSGQLGGGVEETRLYPCRVLSMDMPSNFRLAPMQGLLVPENTRDSSNKTLLPPPPPPLSSPSSSSTSLRTSSDVVELGISCGLFHSALLVDGKLYVWGKGDGGRLGLGTEDTKYRPTLNPNLERIRSVALGGLHSTALTDKGELFTWGYGGFGALGHSVHHRELLPKQVRNQWDGRILYLATSGVHTAAITESGELYTWGRDEGEGRLGLGSEGGPDEGVLATPTKVKALPVPISAISCGGFFTLALTSSGELWSWGGNSNYELGRGNKGNDWRPRPIRSLEGVRIIQIASGGYHSLALTDDGKVFTWGHGGHGELGHGSVEYGRVPQVVQALADERVVYVACGSLSSAAVTDSGKLYMWGKGRDNQLGVPGLPDTQLLPVLVNFLVEDEKLGPAHVLAVSAGASHAMCLISRSGI